MVKHQQLKDTQQYNINDVMSARSQTTLKVWQIIFPGRRAWGGGREFSPLIFHHLKNILRMAPSKISKIHNKFLKFCVYFTYGRPKIFEDPL